MDPLLYSYSQARQIASQTRLYSLAKCLPIGTWLCRSSCKRPLSVAQAERNRIFEGRTIAEAFPQDRNHARTKSARSKRCRSADEFSCSRLSQASLSFRPTRLSRRLSNVPQNSSSVSKHIGQNVSCMTLAEWMETNESHLWQCQRVLVISGRFRGYSLFPTMNMSPLSQARPEDSGERTAPETVNSHSVA